MVGIVSVYCAALVLVAWAGIRVWGDVADKAGRDLYPYRGVVESQMAPWTPGLRAGERAVVWLGDSTLAFHGISYPRLLDSGLYAQGVRTRVVGWLGMDFYDYYFLTTTIVRELRPDVLVLVAHLRLFAPLRSPRADRADDRPGMNDLASFLGPGELAAALGLPLAEHELTLPRLLLAQTLRLPAVEQLHRWFEGGRSLASDASVLDHLGPRELDRGRLRSFTLMRMILDDTDVEVTPDHPIVRTMAATVQYGVARGVCAIVVGTPIPYEALARRPEGYDPTVYARRFAVLRAAVEGAGGSFLDLHEALRAEEFIDVGGHFSREGAEHMARLVGDVVRDTALQRCAATAARVEAQASP